MKRSKNGLLILSLMLVFSMLLSACGAEATPTPSPVDTPTAGMAATDATPTAEMAATDPTATTAAVMGGTEGTVKIVSSLPRTGLSKGQTDDVIAGEMLALEEHKNMAGNFKVELLDWDDATAQAGKWTAETEAANANKAANDPDVMVYLGTFNSGAAKIAIPILNKAGLAMISPANTASELTKKGFDDASLNTLYTEGPRNYFRVVTADDIQGAAAANWATELGFKKVYILNDQEVYGKGVASVFEGQFKTNGGEVLDNAGIDAKAAEFKTLMTKVKESGADLVYFGGLVDSGGPQLVKDLRSVAPEIAFMGPDGIQTQDFIDAAGADLAEGVHATVAGSELADLGPKGKAFYDNFKAKYNHDPDPYAIFGYEAMSVALQAIDKAGKKDRAAIIQAIGETKDYEGALGTWSFDANGDTTLTQIRGFVAEGGKYVFKKYLSMEMMKP